MKIFETKFLPKISDNNQKASQKRCFLNKNVCGDSFTRSNSVSFRAKPVPNLKKTAEKILNNPSMMEKFGAFMAAGFAALYAIAEGKGDENNEDSSINNIVVDILKNMSEEEATNTTIDLPVEEKTEIIPYEVNTVPLEVKENIPTPVELVSVEFPKKKGAGTLSKDYAELKKVVISLKLEKDLAEKLTEICNELLNNKDETVEKLNLDAKAMKEQLSDQDDLKEFIELNYKKLKVQNAPEVENQESVDTVSQKTATEKPKKEKDDPINVNKAVRQKRPRIPRINMNYYEGEPEINQKIVIFLNLGYQVRFGIQNLI